MEGTSSEFSVTCINLEACKGPMKLQSPSSAGEGWLLVRGISTGPAFQNYFAEKTKVEGSRTGLNPNLKVDGVDGADGA